MSLIKGSREAKQRMEYLRSLKKKKQVGGGVGFSRVAAVHAEPDENIEFYAQIVPVNEEPLHVNDVRVDRINRVRQLFTGRNNRVVPQVIQVPQAEPLEQAREVHRETEEDELRYRLAEQLYHNRERRRRENEMDSNELRRIRRENREIRRLLSSDLSIYVHQN